MRSATSRLLALALLSTPALAALTASPAQAQGPTPSVVSAFASNDSPVTPDAVPEGATLGTVGAVLVWWTAANGEGLEVDDYLVERQLVGTTSWDVVAHTGNVVTFIDRTASEGKTYRYRVTAHNGAGYGPDTIVGSPASPDADRALVVAGRTLDSGPSGLYQLDPQRADAPTIPLITDAHDYLSPAVSPGGSRLAFSRSTDADGSIGQYDLWSGTPTNPAVRRLTTMDGVETDAAYSPDASLIAFTSADGSGTSVWVVNALGGGLRKIRSSASAPTWTPDGRSLVVQDDSVQHAPLLSVALSNSAATAVPNSEGGLTPAMSRTGRLAWVDEEGEVLVLDPGESLPLVEVPTPSGNTYIDRLAFDDAGTLYYDKIDLQTGEPVDHRSDHLALAEGPAPLRNDWRAPELTVGAVDPLVRGPVTVNVAAADHGETPDSVLRPQCRLDSAAFTSCKGLTTLSRITEGNHVFTVRVADETGHTTTTTRPFLFDSVGPRLLVGGPTQSTVSRGLAAFTWAASDYGSGVASYEVRISTSTPYSAARAYTVPAGFGSTTTARRLTFRPALGQTTCVRVRSFDRSDLVSGYVTKCATRPLDDRQLRASAGWKRAGLGSGLQGTVSTVARKNATLSTTSAASIRRVGVQGVSCPKCGAVRVYVGSSYVGQVSFAGRTAVRLAYLPVFGRTYTGAVSLRTTSRKAIRIDGLLLSKS